MSADLVVSVFEGNATPATWRTVSRCAGYHPGLSVRAA